MSLIGIIPKRTRFEWTRNEDGTFTMIHREWFNEEDYKRIKEATKLAAETIIQKFGLDTQLSTDDQESSMEVTYDKISPKTLIFVITGELCPQCLQTSKDYLQVIEAIIVTSPVGPLIGVARKSIQEVLKEIGEKVYKLTPEEQKQLGFLLAKVLRPEE